MQWIANPVNDMYADAVLAIILRVDTDPQARKIPVQRITKPDLYREFKDRLEVSLFSLNKATIVLQHFLNPMLDFGGNSHRAALN